MKKMCRRKMMARLMIAFLFVTMLILPVDNAKAFTYTITITLTPTSHGNTMPIKVNVETNEDVESFHSWKIEIYRHSAKVDTLSFTYPEDKNVVGQGATYTSSFTIENESADQQILTFNCYVYDKDGNEVGSGSSTKEPPIVHNFTHVMDLDPTCTEHGYSVYFCSTCQYYDYREVASALNHLLLITHDNNTSNAESKHYTECTRTGCNYEELSDCNFVETTIPANCTKGERHVHVCSGCNYSYILESTSPLDHAYSIFQTMPTCTAEGYTTYTCSRCTDTYTSDETTALGHYFQRDTTRDVSPTCTSAGLEAYTCSRCGKHDDLTLTMLGHDYLPFITMPTCTSEGYTTYTCSRCADTYTSDETLVLGHAPQHDTARDVTPTCISAGLEAHTCSRCGEHDDLTLTMLGHDYLPFITMPTCTSEGYTTYTCSRCADTYTSDETLVLGHAPQRDTVRDVVPTCISAGLEARTCSHCGEHDDVTLTLLGHDYLPVVTMPTCTSEGYTTYICSRCADTYTSDETTEIGHNFQRDSARDISPSCTSAGLEAYTCSHLGCIEHNDTSAAVLGHNYISSVKIPTCTSKGYTTHSCSRCGDSFTDNQTKKRIHWLGEWIPQGNETHKADCVRVGCTYTRTAPCSPQRYHVNGAEISLCPICGETSTGECLKLIQDTSAKAITNTLPNGELIVRSGTMPDGTMFGSIAFEQSDEVQQPEGRVRFTLPVADFEGYSLKLVNPDGSLIKIPVMITEDGLTFELNFTQLPDAVSFPIALIQFFPMTD